MQATTKYCAVCCIIECLDCSSRQMFHSHRGSVSVFSNVQRLYV